MNVILIVADTFRRDHLGCYGNNWIHTPYLDRFAKMAVVFDRAYLCSFPTVPARFELLTGLVAFPTRGWEPMPPQQVTLADRLREQGYVTMGIFDTANLMRRGFNYMKGFHAFEWIRGQEGDEHSIDYYEVELGAPPAKLRSGWEHNLYQHRRSTRFRVHERDYFVAQTMQTASDWLERNYKWEKFFLYLDTFDPHEPWDAPEWYLRLYEKEWQGDRLDYPKGGPLEGVYTEAEIRHIRALYAAEVTLVDKWVGRLLEKIEDLGLLENTLVIFTTDHGTQHGEHGLLMKGFGMYEETCRIPLLLYHPHLRGGRRCRALVQLPEVAATILEAAGGKGLTELHGRSLLPLLRGEKRKIRALAPCAPKLTPQLRERQSLSVTDGKWSLVFYGGERPSELYYLPDDPHQQRNLLAGHPDQARRLLEGFLAFARQHGAPEEVLTPLAGKAG